MLQLYPATEKDLPGINLLIKAAVMTWNLPERVKRLSMSSYLYDELDLKHFEIVLAKQKNQLLGVAAWMKADNNDIPSQQSGLSLHGIFVSPEFHRQGVATFLLSAAENSARQQDLSGILVKAQKDALAFFSKQGFRPVEIINPASDYANRLWKSLESKTG